MRMCLAATETFDDEVGNPSVNGLTITILLRSLEAVQYLKNKTKVFASLKVHVPYSRLSRYVELNRHFTLQLSTGT